MNHVLFNECMSYLRKDFHNIDEENPSNQTFSCIGTTFIISKPWEFEDFTIHPSHVKEFSMGHTSLLSFVSNPHWLGKTDLLHTHLFGQVLSPIISFATLTPVASPRDGYFLKFKSLENIPPEYIEELVFTLPFWSRGPGAHNIYLEGDTEDKFIEEAQKLVKILKNINKETYNFSLQVMRLFQLSLLVKREDFGLSYLLLVSAIEAVAQKEFKNEKSQKHAKESEWNKKAVDDNSFNELLKEYKSLRGKPSLTSKFTKFILKYSPPACWGDIVKSRYEDIDQEWKNLGEECKHPTKMTVEAIEKVLKDAYDYRCKFVHVGEQPPHQSHQATSNKFFEVGRKYNDTYTSFEPTLYPTYELMLGIAKNSILKWIESKAK